MSMFTSTPVVRWNGSTMRDDLDDLAAEEPLEIRVRGRAVGIAMRTPGHDAELAAGFLLAEGVIRTREDILRIEPCDRNEFGNLINVVLAPLVPLDLDRLTRHVFAASSCGLCGKATIDSLRTHFPPLPETAGPQIPAARIAAMPETMRQAQATFQRTGGLHAAGLFDQGGRLLVIHEDVGRHNAVDKVLGHALLQGLFPLTQNVLVVSGRLSFEIMQKALAGGIAIVVAVSAPSSLSVDFARENHQTLVGFTRDRRLNIYATPARILAQ